MSSSHLAFGYPWWLSSGHLVVAAIFGYFLLMGWGRKWPKSLLLVLGAITGWALAAFVVMHFVIDINGPGSLPTQSFLRSGSGRVLDIGAGTGRSSIMVLQARPQASLVALDLFGDSFRDHFGKKDKPEQQLIDNLKIAGVEQRATIQRGDMRELPFDPASFDAIVSAYAVDHVGRNGIVKTLGEASRVLKPGGEFLLMVVGKEPWIEFCFGPLILHNGGRGADWWTPRLQEAGFEVVESGTRPFTLYLLARKNSTPIAASLN